MNRLRSKSFWLSAVGWLGFSVLVVWLGTVALILAAGARPVIRHADAIVVLGAAQYNGRPSPVLKARLDRGIDLFRKGYARRLVVTGGVGRGDTTSEGEVARRYAVSRGIPDSLIMVERRGATSAESMSAAAVLMRDSGLRSALLVSDSYHMLRLELLARRAGIMGYRAPAHTPIDKSRQRWQYLLRESFLFPATALLGAK